MYGTKGKGQGEREGLARNGEEDKEVNRRRVGREMGMKKRSQ